jgi:hypothetical protein
MSLHEPAAARNLPDFVRRFLWGRKPTKSAPQRQHLRAVQERNEMLERHERVRKSIRDVFEKAFEKKLSWGSDEFNRALFMVQTSFRIDPPWGKPKYPGFTWFLVSDAPESLFTAKEHADFYEDILKNNGYPDFRRLAAECRKAASKLEQANATGASALRELVAAYYKQADRYEAFAKHPEQSRWGHIKKWYGLTLETTRAKARFWKALQRPSQKMAQDVLSRKAAILGDIDPLEAGIALVLQAEDGHIKRMACSSMTRAAVRGVAHLLAAAMTGDSEPLRAAVAALNHMLEMLSDFVILYPEASRKVGRIVDQWPILCSPHRRLAHDATNIMAQVDLGRDFEFVVTKGARWDSREQFTSVARDLCRHIETVRDNPALAFLPYAQAAVALPPIPHDPAAIAESGAAQKWWNVAKEAFLFTYPEPEEVECLNNLIKGKARQSPGRIGARILGRLEARFLSLFASDPRRKLAENERDSTKKAVEAK